MSLIDSEQTLLTGAYTTEVYGSVVKPEVEPESTTKTELAAVSKSSVPLVLTFFLQYLMSVTSIYATGRLGPRELAAGSLALCSFNITGLGVYQGMATCLDSFCSQAHGAKKYQLVGVYFQRCSLMMFMLTVFPLCPIWWFSGSILKYLVPDQELAIMSQTYLRVLILGSPALLLFETGKRFLQAQNFFNAGTYVLGMTLPISILLNWLLVWHPTYGLGFVGAPLATSISYWIMSILLFAYVLFIDGRKCWGGLDFKKAVTNWSQMLALALPGVIMVEAEYLAFEVLTIFAASFGTAALAAQSIASNIGTLGFQLPFAVAVAASARVGHFVGRKDIHAAHIVTRVALAFGCAISIFNFTWVLMAHNSLVRLFTDDKEVLQIGGTVLTMVAINQIADPINVLAAGVLRGQGRQKIGSNLNLFSYYVVALPLAYFFAFYMNSGLVGLWGGLIAGVLVLAIAELVCIYMSDWSQIIIDSESRHDN